MHQHEIQFELKMTETNSVGYQYAGLLRIKTSILSEVGLDQG